MTALVAAGNGIVGGVLTLVVPLGVFIAIGLILLWLVRARQAPPQ